MTRPGGVKPSDGHTRAARADYVGCTCATRPAYEFDRFIPGRPAPQGSKKYVGHRRNGAGRSVPVLVEVSKAVKPWRERVAEVAALYWRGLPLDCPLGVICDFVMPRPKRTPKGATPAATTRRGDGDKLTRATWDGITKVVIKDDALIVAWSGSKRIAEAGEQAGCRIRIWKVEQ